MPILKYKDNDGNWAIVPSLTSTTNNNLIGEVDIYSNSETVIGKWVDGKPIYRRMYTGTNSTQGDVEIIATISDLHADQIVGLYGYWTMKPEYNWTVSLDYHYSDDVYSSVTIENDYIYLKSSWFTGRKYCVFIEYTKTTDAENSFAQSDVTNAISDDGRKFYVSSDEPTDSDGENGDIWFVIGDELEGDV